MTINLMKDCELWVDFDSRYYNPQRNRVQDRSGNGRHPEASGGPTFGQSGPDEFEAVSLDGTDDFFDVSQLSSVLTKNADFSVFALATTDTFDSTVTLFERGEIDNAVTCEIDTDGTGLSFAVYNGSTYARASKSTIGANDTVSFSASYDAANHNVTTAFESGKPMTGTEPPIRGNISGVRIGASTNDVKYLDGSFSVFAVWSRALTTAEHLTLNRLTAPRRAQL